MTQDEQHLAETDRVLFGILDDEGRQTGDIAAAAKAKSVSVTIPRLSEIGLEELSKAKAGIRVGAIRSAGFRNMGDLADLPDWQLRMIDGIGEKQADQIRAIIQELVNRLVSETGLTIDPEDRSPENMALITAVCRYRKCAPLRKSLRIPAITLHDLLEEARIQMTVRSAGKWFFSGRRAKESTSAAYEKMEAYLSGQAYRKTLDLLSSYRAAMNVPPDEAYRDFSANSADYYALLENIGITVTERSLIYSSVPAALASEIEDERLDTTLLNVTLRAYQAFGARYVLHQKRVLLGDEMGLGKTIQAIAVMASIEAVSPGQHFLVVCPAGILINWCREIAKHSLLSAYLLHGPDTEDAFRTWQERGGVAVTNYETMGRIISGIDNVMKLALLVIDEAHYIKNPEALRSRYLRRLFDEADRILMMTGTPLENRVEEMCSLLELLDPQLAAEARKHAYMSRIASFRELLSPVYLRRLREDVLGELPPLTETEEWCEMTKEDRLYYSAAVLAKQFTTMRRVSYLQKDPQSSSKCQRLVTLVRDGAEDRRKILVYSYFRDTLDMVSAALGERLIGQITGSTPPEKRQEILDAFAKAPDGAVLALQIVSGGTGLNIQSASMVIFCEPQIKPSLTNQAISRVYRMGQVRNVLVHHLLCADTIDEDMLVLLANKQEIFDDYAAESVMANTADTILDSRRIAELMAKELDKYKNEPVPELPGPAQGS